MQLLLIDNRVPEIETIIRAVNDTTCCLVFNYYHDTVNTILSKVRFLNRRNRVIRDHFCYEPPSGSNVLKCLSASDIAAQAMAYALSDSANTNNNNSNSNSNSDSSSSLPPTPWVVSSADNVMLPPVFFQRIRPIMDPMHENTVCFPVPYPVLVSDLDDIYDTFKTIPYEVDSGTTAEFSTFSTIGIIQHAYLMNGSDTYTFLEKLDPRRATLKNVATDDPTLQTWGPFITALSALITRHQTETLDLMACALYSDPNWKYVIDELETRLAVNIRASLDNTGAASMSGNWIVLI